mmetsp:Transcript_8694/g.12955  ORF Transcript_8694/g.12955 Transcript_8694/m.12955 type:complete len:122 (-) Transcript_8694:28-393(-)
MIASDGDSTTDVADSIASRIADVLISAFKVKECREPTSEEIQDLFDELTEERVAEMLGLPSSDEPTNIDCPDDASDEGSEKSGEDIIEETKAEVLEVEIKSTTQKRKIDEIDEIKPPENEN